MAHILGTGIYFFKGLKEGNYENWGEENDLWTCSNCLNFFADFLFLQNQEFWAFKGPFSGEKTKRYGRRRYALDILILKISLDPIGLHGQGAIQNYIPKFQVATMSLEVAWIQFF